MIDKDPHQMNNPPMIQPCANEGYCTIINGGAGPRQNDPRVIEENCRFEAARIPMGRTVMRRVMSPARWKGLTVTKSD